MSRPPSLWSFAKLLTIAVVLVWCKLTSGVGLPLAGSREGYALPSEAEGQHFLGQGHQEQP